MSKETEIKIPRKKFIRWFGHYLLKLVLWIVADVEIRGLENMPEKGPFILVGNHFSFLDPAVFVALFKRYDMEFIGGFAMPGAPATFFTKLPGLYGYLPVHRGTGSTKALKMAMNVLNQDGVLMIFPEGGSWAQSLRPARPGAAFLAAMTGAPILPVGLTDMYKIFPLKLGKRQKVRVNIGKPFGPFETTGRGKERRRQLDEIGENTMLQIAELLPDRERGLYAEDPSVREAAKGTEIYPYADKVEGEVVADTQF
jgi:1-acyl-sn-glycerol-3-phosphate acyltransferase